MSKQGCTPDISVVIPTYKPGEYLFQCLDSLVCQTIDKSLFEVIIVLNGCKEPYETEINEYIGRHQSLNFRYIQVDQGGVSHARNIGIDNARSEYIAFIDDDDVISEDYLRQLYAKAMPGGVVLCDMKSFTDNPQTPSQNRYGVAYEKNYGKKNVPMWRIRRLLNSPCGKIYHKDVISGFRFREDIHHGEDALFNFVVSKNMRHILFSEPSAAYLYRMRPGSAIHTKLPRSYWLGNRLALLRAYTATYFSHPCQYSFRYYLMRLAPVSASLAAKLFHP